MDPQDSLAAARAAQAQSNLFAQLNQLTLAEQRLITGGPVSQQQQAQFLGVQQQAPSDVLMQQQQRAAHARGPRSAMQLGSGGAWGSQGQARPTSGDTSRLASSLAALAHVQRQIGGVSLHDLVQASGSLPGPDQSLGAGELDAEFLRLAMDGTLPLSGQLPPEPLSSDRPRSSVSLHPGVQAGLGSSEPWSQHGLAAHAAVNSLQQQQQQLNFQLQQQQQQQQVNFQLQQRAHLTSADLSGRSMLQVHPAGMNSQSQSQLHLHPQEKGSMHSHSSPLMTLPAYTTAPPRIVAPMPTLQQTLQASSSSPGLAGWSAGTHGGVSGAQMHHMASPTHHVVSGHHVPQFTHVPGQTLTQWMVSKGLVAVQPQQPGIPMRTSNGTPPTSNTSQQAVLSSAMALQQQHSLQQQQLAAMQGQGWQQVMTASLSNGSLHESPPLPLHASMGQLGGPLYQTSPTQMATDGAALQQQLHAMAQAAQIGSGGMLGLARGSNGYPATRMAPTSAGSASSVNSSKRSGASRRRKAKMYQALNAMVQVVVEQGGDQGVAEAAAAAAAATLKGGVPNLQGGSAACASVVQAVFQQRLQLQTALRQMQGGAAAPTAGSGGIASNGYATADAARSRSQPLSRQIAALHQHLHDMDLQNSGELILTSADDPPSNSGPVGAGGMARTNSNANRLLQMCQSNDWAAEYAEALAGAEGDANTGGWALLLNQLLQADNTETSVASSNARSGQVIKPFGDVLSESEDGDGDGDTLEATLDTEELTFLAMGPNSEQLMRTSTAGLGSNAGVMRVGGDEGPGSSRSVGQLMVVGNPHSSPPVVPEGRWPHVPSVSSSGLWAPGGGNSNSLSGLGGSGGSGGFGGLNSAGGPTSGNVHSRFLPEFGAVGAPPSPSQQARRRGSSGGAGSPLVPGIPPVVPRDN